MSADSLKKDFNLLEFDDYKKVKDQYEDSFIKKVHAVKISEDSLCVKTACIDTEEEKNVAYVGMTRAKNTLCLIKFEVLTYIICNEKIESNNKLF